MSYGLQVRNSNGILIIDTNKRSMEAISWGTMNLVNRTGYRLDLPTGVDAPMVFIRKPSGIVLIIRGLQKVDGDGPHVNFSADRDFTVEYMIAGFRTTPPSAAQTGYGASVFDEEERLTFSTNLAYPRFPYRSITLSTLALDNDNFAAYSMVSGGSPAYQHPAWGSNDWLYWNPLPFWGRDSGSNWHLGLWFGQFESDTRRIETARVNLSNSYHDWWLGWYSASNPGANLAPTALLSCYFVPPT